MGYSRSHLCGCSMPASSHPVRDVGEWGPVINQRPHKIQNEANIKEVWVFFLGHFMFLLAVSLSFCLVLDTRGRLGGLRGKVGSTSVEFEDNEGVSERSGAVLD